MGGGGGFLVDGLEDFENGGDAFTFFIEDEGTVFHAASGEEADIPGAGQFLRGVLGGRGGSGGVLGSGAGDRADGVEVIGY